MKDILSPQAKGITSFKVYSAEKKQKNTLRFILALSCDFVKHCIYNKSNCFEVV